MIKDPATGWIEATIVINGRQLSFAEAMALRVAVTSFRMTLSDQEFRKGLGVNLADGYDHHLKSVERSLANET